MTDISKANPRPWMWQDGMLRAAAANEIILWPENATETSPMGACGMLAEQHQEANAALIVRAVNSFDDLVAALQAVLDDGMLGAHSAHWDRTGGSGSGCPACEANRKVMALVRAALAKAEGKQG